MVVDGQGIHISPSVVSPIPKFPKADLLSHTAKTIDNESSALVITISSVEAAFLYIVHQLRSFSVCILLRL